MATKRSLPTPREEGKANIVSATLRLLETHSPQDITLRDVARESGHGHRLIVEWFGGKGGLFLAVFNQVFGNLTESGELFFADVATRSDVRFAFKLFNYMQVNHPEFIEQVRDGFVRDVVVSRLQSVTGLTDDQARAVTRRLSIVTLGIALFSEFFGLTDDDAITMMRDEFRATTGLSLPERPPTD